MQSSQGVIDGHCTRTCSYGSEKGANLRHQACFHLRWPALRRSPKRKTDRSTRGGAAVQAAGVGTAWVAIPRWRGGAAPPEEAAVAALGGDPRPTPQSATTTSKAVLPEEEPTLSMALTTSYPSMTCVAGCNH